jgi:hypothetical protein
LEKSKLALELIHEEYLFSCKKNPKSLKIKTKLSNVSDCLLIPTLCFEETKSFKESKIAELPKNQIMAPTDEKAMPLQFNEKKRKDKPLIIICMQTPVQ